MNQFYDAIARVKPKYLLLDFDGVLTTNVFWLIQMVKNLWFVQAMVSD